MAANSPFPSRSCSCFILTTAVVLLLLTITVSGRRSMLREEEEPSNSIALRRCPCKQYYEVGAGETLQTISTKCRAPYILEDNPQIQDTDDVYPGLVLFMQCEDGVAF